MNESVTTQTVGSRVADLIMQEGVNTMFTLPEVTFGDIHNRFVKCGGRIVAPHHETAAAYMAEAHAQMTGKFGVTGGNCGPGAANLLPAVVHSCEEGLPVLYLGSERTRVARHSVRRPLFQNPPLVEMMKPATKFAAILENPFQVDELFQEAFRQLTSGRPGPVFIGLPFDMLREEHAFKPLTPIENYRVTTQRADGASIEKVADVLATARNPVIIAGGGLRAARCHEQLAALLQVLDCPVLRTLSGRGLLPDSHPNALELGHGAGLQAAREADVVLVLGSSINEKIVFGDHYYFPGQEGHPPFFSTESPPCWIHVERDAGAVGRNRPTDCHLIGDLRDVISQLTAALSQRSCRTAASRREQLHHAYHAEIDLLAAAVPEAEPIHPGRALLEVQKALPKDVIWVRDGGAFCVWQLSHLRHDFSDVLSSSKMGMLGTGLPYAIGAQIAAGDGKRVCLITGDGSFGFYPMEIETAVRYNLPIVIIVGYDQGWALEVPYYEHCFGETYEVDHEFIRLDKLAETMGAHGEFCDSPDQVAPAVERAFAAQKPALVQVMINRRCDAFDAPLMAWAMRWHSDKEAYV